MSILNKHGLNYEKICSIIHYAWHLGLPYIVAVSAGVDDLVFPSKPCLVESRINKCIGFTLYSCSLTNV